MNYKGKKGCLGTNQGQLDQLPQLSIRFEFVLNFHTFPCKNLQSNVSFFFSIQTERVRE